MTSFRELVCIHQVASLLNRMIDPDCLATETVKLKFKKDGTYNEVEMPLLHMLPK